MLPRSEQNVNVKMNWIGAVVGHTDVADFQLDTAGDDPALPHVITINDSDPQMFYRAK